MTDKPQAVVAQGYDLMAEEYLRMVKSGSSPRERYANKVLENAPQAPRILELGCASGIPITRMLLDRGAQVVANDISTKQLSLAAAHCPEATFAPGDMLALSFEPDSFDGIVGFYSIFHLPRAVQRTMLSKISTWLKPGAMIGFNLATIDEEEIRSEFLGQEMFWSSFSVDDSARMVEDVGLELVQKEVLEAGDGQLDESHPDYGVSFLWILARKGSVDFFNRN